MGARDYPSSIGAGQWFWWIDMQGDAPSTSTMKGALSGRLLDAFVRVSLAKNVAE